MVKANEIKRGMEVKLNAMGAQVEEVMSRIGNVVECYSGQRYHATKLLVFIDHRWVGVEPAVDD